VIRWSKVVAIGLVYGMMVLPLGDVAALRATPALEPGVVKQQIGQFGVGAKVKVKLSGGRQLRGYVAAVGDDGFLLQAKRQSAPRHVAYTEVSEIRLAKLTYRATGQPDPAEARRVVMGLGVARHIMVKTVAGKEYHGNIQAIEQNNFTLLPDHQAVPVQIAYNDVVQLGPNLSTAAKVVIVVVVAAAVALTALVIVLTVDVVRAAK
jgi:ribosome maturation factor RimP